MKTFILNDKEHQIVDNWEELMLDKYIKFARIEKSKDLYFPELYILRLLEILCGLEEDGLDDLDMNEYLELQKSIEFLATPPVNNTDQHIIIDGKDYWFEKQLNQHLSIGAYISARTLIENAENELDIISKLIAILLRPATLIDGKWKQDKFNAEKIEEHSLYLEKNLKAIDIIDHLNFFLSGKS